MDLTVKNRIRHPQTFAVLRPGDVVSVGEIDGFWTRRLRDGDVFDGVAAPEPIVTRKPAPATESAAKPAPDKE